MARLKHHIDLASRGFQEKIANVGEQCKEKYFSLIGSFGRVFVCACVCVCVCVYVFLFFGLSLA